MPCRQTAFSRTPSAEHHFVLGTRCPRVDEPAVKVCHFNGGDLTGQTQRTDTAP